MHKTGLRVFVAVMIILALGAAPALAGKLRLKASHQFAEGDVRDQMIKVFGEKVKAKLPDVSIRVYPAKSLYKPKAELRTPVAMAW